MSDRFLLVSMCLVSLVGLGWIAYATLRVVQIANEMTQLILKTHP